MTKKIILTAVLAVAVVGAAEAAPLKDYSAGKVALDLGFSFGAKVNGSSAKDSADKRPKEGKVGVEFFITEPDF